MLNDLSYILFFFSPNSSSSSQAEILDELGRFLVWGTVFLELEGFYGRVSLLLRYQDLGGGGEM